MTAEQTTGAVDVHDHGTAHDGAASPVALEAHPHQHGYIAEKDAVRNRLRRIEGQVRGVQRLVEEEAYCIDIITQISAAKSALDRVALMLLEDHLGHCVVNGDSVDDQVKEASAAIARLLKS